MASLQSTQHDQSYPPSASTSHPNPQTTIDDDKASDDSESEDGSSAAPVDMSYFTAKRQLPPSTQPSPPSKHKRLLPAGSSAPPYTHAPLAPVAPISVPQKPLASGPKPQTDKGKKVSNANPKKKKAGRACSLCQKAHLTCDDNRPCARCIKKGCPELCQNGVRKKAKYLQEIPDELLERRNTAPSQTPAQPADASFGIPPLDVNPVSLPPAAQTFPASSTSSNFDFLAQPSASNSHHTLAPSGFGSATANLEYTMLSSMLNSDSGSNHSGSTSYASQAPEHAARSAVDDMDYLFANTPFNGQQGQQGQQGQPGQPQQQRQSHQQSQPPQQSHTNPIQTGNSRPYQDPFQRDVKIPTAEETYRTLSRPYQYAQSYHFLIRHLRERFEKNDILRIIRALATFRPSLIALQMPLTEEDEIFVERTFQRTLIELNKLIGYSGTPTVVWRRTGEICLVGTEFCLLTGWSREELVGKKYIFELFDTASVVEYYEAFAKHAFESSSSSVMMQSVVLTPNGSPVPCAFCFSVRRDIFSLPFIVIGSFLPILV